ncbi:MULTISPECIES: DUF1127 domain-containing protein [Rhodomicrobium]|uniref:DUF1127 domain-containing protein n=1 Tax=Rhodomicrobium TaxID=1068 RepID=UPI001FD87817|nr:MULTISPECIES: DUF1127 domain-containing protein [Rhodomicrobium]
MRSDSFEAGRSVAAPSRQGPSLVSRMMLRLESYAEQRRQRRALLELDDHMLKDIGLTRADVVRIANQPHDWNKI